MALSREQLEAKSIEVLMELWSDAHKDLYGFRPRHNPSKEELVDFWAKYDERFERKQAEEREIEARMQDTLNERIDAIVATVKGCTVARAMRLLAETVDGAVHGRHVDWEYVDYNFGVKYGTCKRIYERA